MSEQLKALQRRESCDPFAMGRADAPIVMVKHEDYRCPSCSKFTADVEPQLIERYVEDGTLRIERRDFPVFGEEPLEMAKAGRAAARQGKFWEFHDVVQHALVHHQRPGDPGCPAAGAVRLGDRDRRGEVVNIGCLGAFIGGALSLLSPCSALLLDTVYGLAEFCAGPLLGSLPAGSLGGLVGIDAQFAAQSWVQRVTGLVSDQVVLLAVAVAAVAGLVWALLLARGAHLRDPSSTSSTKDLSESARNSGPRANDQRSDATPWR